MTDIATECCALPVGINPKDKQDSYNYLFCKLNRHSFDPVVSRYVRSLTIIAAVPKNDIAII